LQQIYLTSNKASFAFFTGKANRKQAKFIFLEVKGIYTNFFLYKLIFLKNRIIFLILKKN